MSRVWLLLLLPLFGGGSEPPWGPTSAPRSTVALHTLLSALEPHFSKENGTMYRGDDAVVSPRISPDAELTRRPAAVSGAAFSTSAGAFSTLAQEPSTWAQEMPTPTSRGAGARASVLARGSAGSAGHAYGPQPWAARPRQPSWLRYRTLSNDDSDDLAQDPPFTLSEDAFRNRLLEAPSEEEDGLGLLEGDDATAFDTPGLMGAVYRLAAVSSVVCALSYAGVSSTLSMGTETYNFFYKETLSNVAAMAFPPALLFALVYDSRYASLNDASRALFSSFAFGYAAAACLEVVLASFIWLAVLRICEPKLLRAALQKGDAPFLVPWLILRDKFWSRHGMRKRTRLIAEMINCCILSPLVEELAKLWATRRAVRLQLDRPKPRRGAARPTELRPTELPHVHTYLTHALAASIGFKVADSARRICGYTRSWHPQKLFFAVVRGRVRVGKPERQDAPRTAKRRPPLPERVPLDLQVRLRNIVKYRQMPSNTVKYRQIPSFQVRGALPIHELCAALTATRLARRDAALLQDAAEAKRPGLKRARPQSYSVLRVIAPAALLHASAIFRGMKPAFKPASAAPWVELQLQAWNQPDDATFKTASRDKPQREHPRVQLCIGAETGAVYGPSIETDSGGRCPGGGVPETSPRPLAHPVRSFPELAQKSWYSFMWWALLCRVLALACNEYYALATAARYAAPDATAARYALPENDRAGAHAARPGPDAQQPHPRRLRSP
ncbi:hypothetical protein M885DRAFT_499090 [Pelagophyceae sp. CCMP2097]|nr:hypothetical protein M885DRAFT_499090 [Pelagophyceae sp. CCMP2097]